MHWVFGIPIFAVFSCVLVTAIDYPQGYNVSFYFRACSLSGRLQNGRCCDVDRYTNCPDHCDVHFVVCVREHNETSNDCNSNTSSHITFLHYAYLDVKSLTFFEGDNVFGVGLHNPLVYAFTGNWSKRIQTVLIARDFDFESGYTFQHIDYIDVNWTVPAGRAEDDRTYTGVFMNMVVRVGLKVDCWEGWYGDYCTVFCVPRDDSEGHYTCNADGTKECLFGWTGINCNSSSKICSPPCPINKICDQSRCDTCAPGYGGVNCTCTPGGNGCDPIGGYCLTPEECRCHTGYHGTNCSELYYCVRWGNPCTNGGNCVSLSNNTFMCDCVIGYMGERCESRACPFTECSSAPNISCNNGGVCKNATGGPQCECAKGYTGVCCDVVINNCVNNPCDHGSCKNMVGDYTCECDAGYMGKNCSEDINECVEQSPCENSGTCSNRIGHYFCYCPLNYTGVNCSEHVTSCGIVTCENGNCGCQCSPQCDQGTCANTTPSGPPKYRCICITGFNGTACDNDINDCTGQCTNGGSCVDRINGFTCHCVSGYTGEKCRLDVNECDNAPCMNGGVCSNSVGGYSCECQPTYTGDNCGTFVQLMYCEMNDACQNGGICKNEMFGTSCECTSEYNGTHCEMYLDPCIEINCYNNGTCDNGICDCTEHYTGEDCTQILDVCGTSVAPSECPSDKGTCLNTPDTSEGYTCRCEVGYTGDRCGTDINDCAGNPCGDNGDCVDLINEYECECTAGYTGDLCDQIVNNCEENPCLNNGDCQNGINSYTCACPEGTVPPVCQQEALCNRTSCSLHGECQRGDGEISCECDEGYTGEFCGSIINLCDSSPCTDGAICYQGINSYVCKCETSDIDCSDQTSSNTQDSAGGIGSLLPVIMGVLVGVLATLVVVLTVGMICLIQYRRRRHNTPGVPRYIDNNVLDAGVVTNPVYAEMDTTADLPCYAEIGGQNDMVKIPLENVGGTDENIYERVHELKQDILEVYGQENLGFEGVDEEKKTLESMYGKKDL